MLAQLPDDTIKWLDRTRGARRHDAVDPKVRAEQMGHTVDVNENVYTRTSLERRRKAVNALESALEVM